MAAKAGKFSQLAMAMVVLAPLVRGVPVAAQNTPKIAATPDAMLLQMARAAGVIFVGQVVAVRRPVGFAGSGENAAEGIVEVDFAVSLAVRGPAAGSIYTLREWAGLWNARNQRYWVGQRSLVFLYQPDSQGLSSPVHGSEGLVPLFGGGNAPGPDTITNAKASWSVDLRWLQAQVLRRSTFSSGPVHRPVASQPNHESNSEINSRLDSRLVHGFGPERDQEIAPLARRLPTPWPPSDATSVQTEPLTQVIALCQQAMRNSDAAR